MDKSGSMCSKVMELGPKTGKMNESQDFVDSEIPIDILDFPDSQSIESTYCVTCLFFYHMHIKYHVKIKGFIFISI
jgi:hypothetical protein